MNELFAGYTSAWVAYLAGLLLVVVAQCWLLRGLPAWLNGAVAVSLLLLMGFPIEAYPGEPVLAPALWVALFEGLLGGGDFARAGAPLATVWVIGQGLYWVLAIVIWLFCKLFSRGC